MSARRSLFPQISDEELVLGSLIGDLEAFDELVRRFRAAVTAVAAQTVATREQAEDVAQDAFLTAFKALPQLEDPSRFGAWLCAITRHRARRVAGRELRAAAVPQSELNRMLVEQSAELGRRPEERLSRHAADAEIRSALASLPEGHRLVLELYYLEQWSVKQLSDFLSLPVTTVKWRLHSGRLLLRRRLIEPEEEPRD